MTINDLRKVYFGKVLVTALAFDENGKCKDFRTLHDDYMPEEITKLADYMYSLEILRISPSNDYIRVDVKDV